MVGVGKKMLDLSL